MAQTTTKKKTTKTTAKSMPTEDILGKEIKTMEDVNEAADKLIASQAELQTQEESEDKEIEEATETINESVAIMKEIQKSSEELSKNMEAHPEKAGELVEKELQHIEEAKKKLPRSRITYGWNGFEY